MASKKEVGCRHKFVTLVLEKPTCEKSGRIVRTCVKCRYNIFQESTALGHQYQRNETGDKVCVRCGYQKPQLLIEELKDFSF